MNSQPPNNGLVALLRRRHGEERLEGQRGVPEPNNTALPAQRDEDTEEDVSWRQTITELKTLALDEGWRTSTAEVAGILEELRHAREALEQKLWEVTQNRALAQRDEPVGGGRQRPGDVDEPEAELSAGEDY